MIAALYKGVGKIECEELPTPPLEPGTVLLKVEACAICGTDRRSYRHGHASITTPVILGHEVVGIVEAVGDGADCGLDEGDRIAVVPAIACGECDTCKRGYPPDLCRKKFGMGRDFAGGFAEYCLLPPAAVHDRAWVKVPEGLDPAVAVLAEPGSCALRGVERSAVGEGDTVVVMGAGPIGSLQALLSRNAGAARVILVAPAGKRMERAREFGVADRYVLVGKEDVREAVLAETDGHGANAVLTATSSPAASEQAFHLVDHRGRINLFAGLPKDHPEITINSNDIHYGEWTVTGTAGASKQSMRRFVELLVREEESFARLVTHRLGLDRLSEGLELTTTGEALKAAIMPELTG